MSTSSPPDRATPADDWSSLFKVDEVATLPSGVREAALCVHCKCSHGCKGLLDDFVGAHFLTVGSGENEPDAGSAVVRTISEIDAVRQTSGRHAARLAIATGSSELGRINEQGQTAVLIGLHGGRSFQNSAAVLRSMRLLGISYLSIAPEDVAEPAQETPGQVPGDQLATLADVIRLANGLGILLDISGLDAPNAEAVLQVTSAPAIYAGAAVSGSESLRQALVATGSLVVEGIDRLGLPDEGRAAAAKRAAGSHAVRHDPAAHRKLLDEWAVKRAGPAIDFEKVAEGIDASARIFGIDHVGLATSSYETLPAQSVYGRIAEHLRKRGHTSEAIQKVLGGNFARVLGKVEQSSDRAA